ncbi:Na+/H+ antiporter [Salinisphaera sp. Q1T1-3]|uniref:Na+/H+ antiporter n=1 Tax=Salinisphaera sp. Q1T1-3 TaxID=2321229 RepID=UPI000E744C3E|nr:Na+/H+ antiporter [Salinisphaera sp. Q1T1-3]RJS91027.1 Na+/H+ antiporter [Salinisphaera sp. Q1T1-3]
MSIVLTSLILLFTVALSGVLIGLLPLRLPRPLVQIAMGAALAVPSFGLHVQLHPEIFFLLFIPPLLFIDGWRMPQREFRRLVVPITALALGLVMVTVLCVGLFIHWLIPAIPLAAGFALGAVLSPTDAVAVSAITGGSPIPPRMLHVLQGEALMNDASGLVALRFGVAAAMTGAFSLPTAALSFVLIAAGGLAVGWAIAWLFAQIRHFVTQWRGDDPASHVALLVLLPFAAYLLAEHLGVSGILAAVAAGMTLNSIDTLKGELNTRMQSRGMWTMLEFVFNGLIFVLLGQQIPAVWGLADNASVTMGLSMAQMISYPFALFGLLLVTRFIWVAIMIKLASWRAVRRGETPIRPSTRVAATTAIAGVRGAITLAAVLSLPLAGADGQAFPGRGLFIYLAVSVILISLAVATVALPPLLKRIKLPADDPRAIEERRARAAAAKAAIKRLDTLREQHAEEQDDADEASLYSETAGRIMASYQPWLDPDADTADKQRARRGFAMERTLRLSALDAEREALYQLRRDAHINDITMRRVLADIDLTEASLRSRRRSR